MGVVFSLGRFGHLHQSCIEIPYRDEGNGGGAFYDHYTVQRITKRKTKLSVPTGMSLSSFESYVASVTTQLRFGTSTGEGKKIPPVVSISDRVGLLIITGHARQTETKRPQALALRDAHECKLLQKALNQGRPVLAICAGLWQAWTFLGGGLQNVKDHAWERMPAINANGSIGFNTQIHKVCIVDSSMLAGAIADWYRYADYKAKPYCSQMQRSDIAADLTVNSVHWKAADLRTVPSSLTVVATAKRDDSVAPKRKKSGEGVFKIPDDGTVEAIEQTYGAPFLGVQWHPEAYNIDGSINSLRNRSIVTYMSKAGDTFCLKQRMVSSFAVDVRVIKKSLRNISSP